MPCIDDVGRLCGRSPGRWQRVVVLSGATVWMAGCVSTHTAPPPVTTGAASQGSRPVAVAPAASSESAARTWDEYKLRAARRLVAANQHMTYSGPAPEPLLAIPVIEVELRSDGSIANLKVVREPRQAKDTIQLALDAVKRAAPFGDVSRLPKPWKYTEVFLFNDDRQFKPRTLDD